MTPTWNICHQFLYCSVGVGSARPLYFKEVFNLITFVVYLFCSLSSSFFHRVNHRSPPVGAKGKEPKRPAHGLSKSLKALVRATLLTTPPYRIPCGANYVCTTHDYMLAVLSICIANSGTKELASRTPIIVWHTRSDTFVLVPQLELTRAVAQTVPVFF